MLPEMKADGIGEDVLDIAETAVIYQSEGVSSLKVLCKQKSKNSTIIKLSDNLYAHPYASPSASRCFIRPSKLLRKNRETRTISSRPECMEDLLGKVNSFPNLSQTLTGFILETLMAHHNKAAATAETAIPKLTPQQMRMLFP